MTATSPEGFYVTVRDNGRTGMLLGPYAAKEAAETDVPTGRRLAESVNDRAIWYAYGVTKVTVKPGADLPAGKLEHLRQQDTAGVAGGTIAGVSANGRRVVIAQYTHRDINDPGGDEEEAS